MEVDTPYADTPWAWILRVQRDDPGRDCLVSSDGILSYGDVFELVTARMEGATLGTEKDEIVPIAVTLEVHSIIELLALQVAGSVPLPYIGQVPELPVASTRGAAVCVLTSGTSGTRRIVPLTHPNISASVKASRERIVNTADDRWLLSLPLNHVGGLSILWRSFEVGGAVIVAPFDASGETIEIHRPTFVSLVPTMLHRLLDQNPAALASIGTVLVGGAPLSPQLWKRARDAGVHIFPTYGMTETGSQIATLAPGDERREMGLVGPPLEDFTVVILGPGGDEVPAGVTGRIAVDGPAVFSGYLGEKPRTEPFITSDLGHLSNTGDLYVEGRSDDVIVTGGENVSLQAVEAAIAGVGGVKEVCVVSLADDEWGTVVAAIIVTDAPEAVIRGEMEKVLERHEYPRRMLVSESIPHLPNGKRDISAVRGVLDSERILDSEG